MRSRGMKEDMAEDRRLWRFEMDRQLSSIDPINNNIQQNNFKYNNIN